MDMAIVKEILDGEHVSLNVGFRPSEDPMPLLGAPAGKLFEADLPTLYVEVTGAHIIYCRMTSVHSPISQSFHLLHRGLGRSGFAQVAVLGGDGPPGHETTFNRAWHKWEEIIRPATYYFACNSWYFANSRPSINNRHEFNQYANGTLIRMAFEALDDLKRPRYHDAQPELVVECAILKGTAATEPPNVVAKPG